MDVKDAMAGTVTAARDQLTGLSHRLHAHPEVAWTEERAAAWVSAELAGAGFDVEANACGLPTAFTARDRDRPAAHRDLRRVRRPARARPRLRAQHHRGGRRRGRTGARSRWPTTSG